MLQSLVPLSALSVLVVKSGTRAYDDYHPQTPDFTDCQAIVCLTAL
jgi:hypothetical protein